MVCGDMCGLVSLSLCDDTFKFVAVPLQQHCIEHGEACACLQPLFYIYIVPTMMSPTLLLLSPSPSLIHFIVEFLHAIAKPPNK